MNEFDTLEEHIRRARVERSAAIGIALGNGIAYTWFAVLRLTGRLNRTLADWKASHTANPGPTTSRTPVPQR